MGKVNLDEIDRKIAFYKQAAYLANPNKYKHVGNSMVRDDAYKANTSIKSQPKRMKKKGGGWFANSDFVPGIIVMVVLSLAVGGILLCFCYLVY